MADLAPDVRLARPGLDRRRRAVDPPASMRDSDSAQRCPDIHSDCISGASSSCAFRGRCWLPSVCCDQLRFGCPLIQVSADDELEKIRRASLRQRPRGGAGPSPLSLPSQARTGGGVTSDRTTGRRSAVEPRAARELRAGYSVICSANTDGSQPFGFRTADLIAEERREHWPCHLHPNHSPAKGW